jgi:hypothetical protein
MLVSIIIATNLDTFAVTSLSDLERITMGVAVGTGLLFAPAVLLFTITDLAIDRLERKESK